MRESNNRKQKKKVLAIENKKRKKRRTKKPKRWRKKGDNVYKAELVVRKQTTSGGLEELTRIKYSRGHFGESFLIPRIGEDIELHGEQYRVTKVIYVLFNPFMIYVYVYKRNEVRIGKNAVE